MEEWEQSELKDKLEGVKVLLVEDDEKFLRILRFHLDKMGFREILDARDGQAAWEILSSNPVDLVIADWHMPEMDGLEFFKKMKENETFKKIPFLMVTGEAHKEKIADAFKNGVKNYITKPFEGDDLRRKVARVLNLNWKFQEKYSGVQLS